MSMFSEMSLEKLLDLSYRIRDDNSDQKLQQSFLNSLDLEILLLLMETVLKKDYCKYFKGTARCKPSYPSQWIPHSKK